MSAIPPLSGDEPTSGEPAATAATRADRDRPLLATYPAVCFAFYGGDKVRGEKVHECSDLGSEMPARWPQDPKRSGAIGVVVQHSDEQTFTKLPAYGCQSALDWDPHRRPKGPPLISVLCW
jgi:hypothetical protein